MNSLFKEVIDGEKVRQLESTLKEKSDAYDLIGAVLSMAIEKLGGSFTVNLIDLEKCKKVGVVQVSDEEFIFQIANNSSHFN